MIESDTKQRFLDKSFDELRDYVSRKLEDIQEHGDVAMSEPELLQLCDLLKEKAREESSSESTPQAVLDDSEELGKLKQDRDRLRQVADRYNALKRERHRLRKAKRRQDLSRLPSLRAEITLLRTRNVNFEATLERLEKDIKKNTMLQRIRQNVKTRRSEIADTLRTQIERAYREFDELVPIELPWKLVPPGEQLDSQLFSHFGESRGRSGETEYDAERLRFLTSLKPSQCFVGLDKFDGYVVFTFSGTTKVVFENPRAGNATYIIDGDWRELSTLTKHELVGRYPEQTTRIIHRGQWPERIAAELHVTLPLRSSLEENSTRELESGCRHGPTGTSQDNGQ